MDEYEPFLGDGYFRCEACGFTTPHHSYSPDRHLYHCHDCSDIVFPKIVPFLFVPPDCPKCARQLRRPDRIHAPTNYAVECPKCRATALREVQDIGVSMYTYEGDSLPAMNETIHGYVLQGEEGGSWFTSPRLFLAVDVTLDKARLADLPSGYYAFTVLEVSETQLLLRYDRELPKTVWGGYFRPPDPDW